MGISIRTSLPVRNSVSSTCCLKYVSVMAYFSGLNFFSRVRYACFAKGNPRNALVWLLVGSTFPLH